MLSCLSMANMSRVKGLLKSLERLIINLARKVAVPPRAMDGKKILIVARRGKRPVMDWIKIKPVLRIEGRATLAMTNIRVN